MTQASHTAPNLEQLHRRTCKSRYKHLALHQKPARLENNCVMLWHFLSLLLLSLVLSH